MGSRIMHAIIGYKIAESLAIVDQTSFLLGSVAPDAVSSFEEKNLSHFYIGEARDYSRRIDFASFLHQYKEQVEGKNPYIMGYCTHLVADDIWLRGFYLSWLKNRMDTDEGLYQLYHNDFRLLNGKLLEYYDLTNELKKSFSHFPNIIDLQEVKSNDVEKFVPYVLEDMNFNKDLLNANLQVFTFDMIVGYIETSIEVGLLKIKPLLD